MKVSLRLLTLFSLCSLIACNQNPGEAWNQETATVSRVINGSPVSRDTSESKSVVLIELLDASGLLLSFCTGTIVSPKFVLTAGHCFDTNLIAGVARSNIIFDTVYNFRRLKTSTVKNSVRGGNATKHPEYNKEGQWDHDAALLPIKGAIPAGFGPVVLDDKKHANYEGQRVTIYGFGRSQNYSGVIGEDFYQYIGSLRRGTLTVDNLYNQFQDRYYTVAGSNQQVCQGDSGGPQFLTSKNGSVKQVGINSAVEGPQLPNGIRSCYGPAHATKVAYMYDWIQKQIR